MSGALYLVATPIGNLSDITLRALEVLKACPIVVAEDTRRSRTLLTHFGITGKDLRSLHGHSSQHEVSRIADAMEAGSDVALVTDAGTPAVSDPGDALSREVLKRGLRVVPIPGPSAVLAALAASGLGTGSGFRFLGFLPRDGVTRAAALSKACGTEEPVVLFEAPNRVHDTLTELAALDPERPACVARELTKMHEELVRGALRELAAVTAPWLGEIVIVLGERPARSEETIGDAALDARIDDELAKGGHAKSIAERLAAWSGRSKRDVYERVVGRKK